MAAPSINSKIKLDGEREYKAALAEIKSGLNVLKSELNLASEQFRDNADSVEALTKKNDILDRTILTQKEKIEQIEKALQSSASAYGEADERTNRWKTQLNNAQAELVKMERALKDNEDALQKAQKETDGTTTAFGKLKKALSDTKEQGGGLKSLFANLKEEFSGNDEVVRGLGDALTDVAGKFGIQLPEGAQKAVESLNGINAGAALAVTGLGLVAAAVVKAEKALVDITKEAGAAASEILKLSSVTGQSTESIQEFDYAAEMIGVSSDRIRDSLKETTNKMQEARDGNEATAAAYAKLGVAITDADGNLRSAEDVFYDTIDALGQMENRTERDAVAMDLMSESAQELNPLIDAGSDTLKKYADEAHEMGYVLDNDALTSLKAVDTGFQTLQKTQEAVKNQMAAEFAPYLTKALEDIRELIQKIGKALIESGAVDAFGSILESSVALLEPLGSLISAILPVLAAALKPIAQTVALIADTANVIVGLFTFNGAKIKTALGLNASSGQLSNMQRASGAYNGYRYSQSAGWITEGTYTDAELRSMYNSEVSAGTAQGTFEAWKNAGSWRRNASGTDWFPGGRTLLSEHGAETAILPQGTRILTAQETRQSGGDIYNITIDAHTVREFEDILRIVQERRRVVRMGGATG